MSIYVFLYSCALSSCVCRSVYLFLCICVFVLPGAHSVSWLKNQDGQAAGRGLQGAKVNKGEQRLTGNYAKLLLPISFICNSRPGQQAAFYKYQIHW